MAEALFDRFIDVKLSGPGVPPLEIPTYRNGVKQEMSVSGTFLPGALATNVELRIANLFTSRDFFEFQNIEITAGYNGTKDVLSSKQLTGTIYGQIFNAYKESPGPDGTTVFQTIVGNYLEIAGSSFIFNFPNPNGTQLLGACLDALKAQSNGKIAVSYSSAIAAVPFPGEIKDEYGTLKEHLDSIQTRLRQTFGTSNLLSKNNGFLITTEGDSINCFFEGDSTKPAKEIKYLSSPPRVEGGSISFISPWDPTIRINDPISIKPSFAKQSFGGSQTNPFVSDLTPIIKSALTIAFDFSTTQNINTMNVKCLFSR